MNRTGLHGDIEVLARRAQALSRDGERALLGIAGSPGSGKTTFAAEVVARVNALDGRDEPFAVALPMDGFHLANATLDQLGRHDRKGAIDTFDGWGFVALLRRLLIEDDHTVYAPGFDRAVDEPVAGAIAVPSHARLVVVEGNYLLAGQEPWAGIRDLLDESWFVETSDTERMRRLVERHQRHGRTAPDARAWAQNVDGANALLIEATRPRATLVVDGRTDLSAGRPTIEA
ncbi:nucleoside/nucleotide kinase family protein [Leifsonia sp. NPDC058248]|uniref:nucleoside/nucleotide kinase family protein n=1 Tax=Leifsonia sp. NPDC058248 TaxID=3346402 RepID=UPI0036DCB4CE